MTSAAAAQRRGEPAVAAPRGLLGDLSLHVKLPFFLSAALAIAIAVSSWVAYLEVRRAEEARSAERLTRVMGQMSALLSNSFAARRAEAVALGAHPEVVAALRAGEGAGRGAREALERVIEPEQAFAVTVLDTLGRTVLEAGESRRAPADRLPPTVTGGALSPLMVLEGGVVYVTVAPVVGTASTLGSVAIWRSIELAESARATLGDLIGADLTILLGSDGGAWTDLAAPTSAPPLLPLDVDPKATVWYDRPPVGRVLATAERVGGAPWYLVIEEPDEVALAGTRSLLWRLAWFAPLALLVGATVAWFFGRAITRSLRETALAAEAIAAGDTGTRVTPRGRDEIGRLAASFNAMADRVEESHRALTDLNASLATMLEGAPLPIIVFDLEGRVRLWNRASERTFGWTATEVVGVECPLVAPDGEPLDVPRSSENTPGHECVVTRKDGERIDLFVARAPTLGASGAVDGHMLVCEDITQRKRAEEQLERYAADLSRSNAELEDFAYAASHDLREPLRMVRSFTQLLAQRYQGRLDEEADKYIHFAADGATRMEGMVRALLEYSKLDGRPGEVEPSDTVEVLQQAVVNLSAAIQASGARVSNGPLPVVPADPGQLVRVFQNLVGNAVKFRGDDPPEVHVSARREGPDYVFSVSDNGIGIDEAYHDRVFVIFRQLHARSDFEGTGMGLAICKKIVERHGGRIWVESTPGGGSTFHFTLPAHAAWTPSSSARAMLA